MNVEEYEALRAQEDQEELARLREQYSVWLEPHEVYCFINATPADFLTWLGSFRQRVFPKFPQDPTVATWGGLGIDSYPTFGRPGGSENENRGKPVDGHLWRCVPLPYGMSEPEPGTLPVSTVWIEAWAVTAAPARTRLELRLNGPHLGRWYEALQAFVLENYPEAGAWRRVHPATAGSTSSTTPPEPPSGERAATRGSPPGEPAGVELTREEENIVMIMTAEPALSARQLAGRPGVNMGEKAVRTHLTKLYGLGLLPPKQPTHWKRKAKDSAG